MMFDWLKQNLYDPLGYKVYRNHNFSNILLNMISLSKNEAMIHQEMQIPKEEDLLKQMLDQYDHMESLSFEFKKNQDVISDGVLDSLKKLHIFWNVYRQRDQLKNMHSTTLNFIREMLFKFKKTNDAMKATTIDMLYHIKNAYYKFLRAHKLMSLIRDRAAEILTVEILRRFKNNIEAIHSGESDYELRI